MTLLSMCAAIAPKIAIDTPSSIVGNDNDDAALLLQLAQEEGFEYSRRYYWQKLRREHTFTSTAAEEQIGAIPDDFDCMIGETFFNRSLRREVAGPITPQAWQQTKATLITAVNPTFIIRGDALLITPTPSAGEDMAYEYQSLNWCFAEDGTGQTEFAADTDTIFYPEAIFKLGLIWRFKQQKGYEHETDRLKYERAVTDQAIRDGGKPRINTAEVTGPTIGRRGKPNIPDYNTITG